MNLTRFWDWLDEQGANLIKILYLLYMVTAVAQYFQDGGPQNANLLNALLGGYSSWALALGLSFHAYITARRVKAAHANASAMRVVQAANRAAGNEAAALKNDAEIAAYRNTFTINLWVLGVLLGFDIWNQAQYLVLNWHPGEHLLSGPDWLQIVIKAVIIPVLFMSLAFLSPAAKTFHEQIQEEAATFAREVFGVARRQWRDQLRAMKRQRQDVTGLVLDLVDDEQARLFLQKVQAYMPNSPRAIAAPVPFLPLELDQGSPFVAPASITVTPEPTTGALYTSAAPTTSTSFAMPRPGTRKFRDLVHATGLELLNAGNLSVFNIAQTLGVDPSAVEDAIRALHAQRIGALKPGKTLTPDPVLDALRISEPVSQPV